MKLWRFITNKHKLITSGLQEADAMAAASKSSYWILVRCYTAILFFAIWEYKLKNWIKN
ncbi:MAG: FHS family L-fucose permease-like MFS transporter [Ulvibacter sp.]|jgi:FHS family L-fucose permease-like MFS transporter